VSERAAQAPPRIVLLAIAAQAVHAVAMRPIVLASTSAHRRALMARLGCEFEPVSPELDESPWQQGALSADQMVVALSEAKARAVAKSRPDALIIGSDQCAEIDGHILGKPGGVATATDQLALLAGRSHRLLTGLCVLDALSGRAALALDVHLLTMRKLSRQQILRYVQREQPLDCAGSYRIEGRGIALFESIQGEDHTAIIGLPMMKLVTLLIQMGVDPFGD
jgi:septum formation protein